MRARSALVLLVCSVPLTWAATPQRGAAQAPTTAVSSRAESRHVADSAAAPLERHVSLDLSNATVGAALQAIVAQSGINLSYSGRVVPVTRRVSVHVTNVTVREALALVLAGTEIDVQEADGRIVLGRRHEVRTSSKSVADSAQYGTVWGRVVDSVSTRGLVGAVLSVEGTTLTARSDDSGYYALTRVPEGVRVLLARIIGYSPTKRTVVVAHGPIQREDFAMPMGMSRLQEVVTTATGPRRRMELGNDITLINADSIAATQPITSVTDLLEGRVPGLTVQHSSGAPGDPARLRLRGSSSAYLSNDPIVIVDGVRIYSAASASRSANLAATTAPAPSPLDEIDPNSIATIEVLKGPSAATLYGVDAANGVIVITTKTGRPGPPRWTASTERGVSTMPGSYPDGYLRWGHSRWDNTSMLCPLTNFNCVQDSVVRFQALNDPMLTALGRGDRTAGTVGVSGGSEALTYSVNGSYGKDYGLLKLPEIEVGRYRDTHGTDPPDWMQRPQQLTEWSASSRLTAKLGASADVSLTTMLSRTNQQRSSLENQLVDLMTIYVDRNTGTYYRPSAPGTFSNEALLPADAIVSGYYTQITDEATQFTNGASLSWRIRTWLTASADGGINVIQRNDAQLLPRGASLSALSGDSTGSAIAGRGSSLVSTVNVRSTATAPLAWGFKLQTTVGANYTDTRSEDLSISTSDLASGGTSVAQAGKIDAVSELRQEEATFGWYVEPTIAGKRLWISTGLRLDGGNSFGSHASLAAFPKVNASYLLSDEPFFPFKSLFNTFRLRIAYGHAGVQPGPGDRLRLFSSQAQTWADGHFVDALTLQTLGNDVLKPERSVELEGGFDADLLDDRISLGVTGYRKTRIDALMNVPLPPSVYGDGLNILENVGTIRNTGYNITLGAQLVRTDLVTWRADVSVSHNKNLVVALGPGVEPFQSNDSRVVAGYPLGGRWGKPVLGYGDLNDDGVLEPNEVLYGDSLVFLGLSEPDFTGSLQTTLSFFRGTVTLSGSFLYTGGVASIGPWADLRAISRGLNDPTSSLGEQAVVLTSDVSDFLNTQTTNTLRFNSLSIAYNVSHRLAQLVGARSLSIALQGTNLGLHTNYRGLDPDVGYGYDRGTLPQPRTWQVRVSAGY